MYPIELEIKDTTDTARSASYIDLCLDIAGDCMLRTHLHDIRDDFNFHHGELCVYMLQHFSAAPA